jgi:hypothetical protein
MPIIVSDTNALIDEPDLVVRFERAAPRSRRRPYEHCRSPQGSVERNTGFFGADARVLPDAWNSLSDLIRLYAIGGAGTGGGWGIGAGLHGNGFLQFLSCNPAYSSRPASRIPRPPRERLERHVQRGGAAVSASAGSESAAAADYLDTLIVRSRATSDARVLD